MCGCVSLQALPKGSLPVPVHVVEAEWKLVRDFLLSPPDTRVWTAESWENAVVRSAIAAAVAVLQAPLRTTMLVWRRRTCTGSRLLNW